MNPRPLPPQGSALPTAPHPDAVFFSKRYYSTVEPKAQDQIAKYFIFLTLYLPAVHNCKIVVIQNRFGIGNFVFYNGIDISNIIFVCSFAAFGRSKLVSGIVVITAFGFPVIVGPNYNGFFIREYVAPHKKAGIVLYAKKVAQGRKNVKGIGGGRNCCSHIAVFIFKAARPKNKCVVVSLCVVGHGIAVKLAEIIFAVAPLAIFVT